MLHNVINIVLDFISKNIFYKLLCLKGIKKLQFKKYSYNKLDNLYEKGHALIFNNEFIIFGNSHILNDFSNLKANLSHIEQEYIHSFEWLYHLKAVGTLAAKEKARFFLKSWIKYIGLLQKQNYSMCWQIETLGERLSSLILCLEFLELDGDLGEMFNISYAQQYKHLSIMHNKYCFVNKIGIAKALILGSVLCDRYNKKIKKNLEFLRKNLQNNLFHDGGHISRNIEESLNILEDLIILYDVVKNNNSEDISFIRKAICKIDPFIRTLRHSSGELAVFNGSLESTRYKVNLLLSLSNVAINTFVNLKDSKYISVKSHNATLIVDVGENQEGYDSLMAFELSFKENKIITNLGSSSRVRDNKSNRIRGQNSCLILEDKNGIIDFPFDKHLKVDKRTEEKWEKVTITYNGLKEQYGIIYYKTLFLYRGKDNYILGENLISFPKNYNNSIKKAYLNMYLHPVIDSIDLYQGKQNFLFSIKDKKYFFNTPTSKISLLKSFYHGRDIYGERCYMLDIPLVLDGSAMKIEWSILPIEYYTSKNK